MASALLFNFRNMKGFERIVQIKCFVLRRRLVCLRIVVIHLEEGISRYLFIVPGFNDIRVILRTSIIRAEVYIIFSHGLKSDTSVELHQKKTVATFHFLDASFGHNIQNILLFKT